MVKKTIEETYKKLTQREHVLLRSGMYIGSIKKQLEELWVPNNETYMMEKKMIEYSPGFMKIFDEILTNATDHSFRYDSVTQIKVNYDKETGEICVWNNGPGIPVIEHQEHKIYVPELIFGHLLSGSNYNDNDSRTGAGTNGLGSKCTNIYSKKFQVETIDSDIGKKFVQEYSNNMTDRTKPNITNNSKVSYTKITFIPDYMRFDMQGLEDDTILLINKRVIDCIACTSNTVEIYLNGELLKGKGMNDYTKYYFDDAKIFSESFRERVKDKKGEFVEYIWEYSVVPYSNFEQVSFVNGNACLQGGKHVDYIIYQIINKLKTMLETKKKLKELKPNFIKDKLFLFLRATVANPTFNSQTKEQLTTPSKDFGCVIQVSDSFINKLYKSSITDEIVEFCKAKEIASLGKHSGKKISKIYIPKLEDALWAGTNKSEQCTLILTEGLSALTFALHGRSVVGPEKYATFPLKGKLLNTKDATISQLVGNEEINNIKQIIGLKQDKVYKNTSELRYGKVMILTDADSVTFDTPCIIKNIETNEIEIKPICEINNNNWSVNILSGKEYSNCKDYLVWSDNGWTKIKSIMRHLVNKPIHRVLTHTGCVDVTEDHSLLNKDGNEITVKDCIIKSTELLHKKYDQENIIDYNINRDLAWAMGYFQADGHCFIDGIIKQTKKDGTITESYNFKWEISSVNEEPLIKLQKIFQDNEKHTQVFAEKEEIRILDKLEFIIIKKKVSKDSFLEISGREYIYLLQAKGTRKNIVGKYRKMFYNSLREKKVPTEILNNTLEIQQSFIDGFYAGDGNKGINHTTDCFDREYKSQIMGLFQILQNCGYNPSINCSSTKLNVYTVLMSKHKGYNRQEHTINKIINVSDKYKNTYVYDFETENHHFHASIGNMIVHNCDGGHIKALFVNFIHTFWPSLLNISPDFIQTIKTPIVKAIKGKNTLEFFTEQDYLKWKDTGINLSSYKVKYFKGLGSSSKDEAKDIFKRFDELKVDYYFKDQKCNDAISLAFEKDKNIGKCKKIGAEDDMNEEVTTIIKCTDRRKAWLEKYDKNTYIDTKQNRISYQDLINKELIHFSIYDNLRSIPSLCDGLKPSQRKILYYMLKNNKTQLLKVAQLSGYVSAETGYHHGEDSLQGAIINMAQNFVGTNNINLLYPDGNFGTRYILGKDAASPRYIFTRLCDITQVIFNKNDSPLLDFLDDNGSQIEPEWYLPIIPMILVNGCSGIGTGYSTSIPSYNPLDIIKNLINMIDNDDYQPLEMKPYFKGFHGSTIEIEKGSFITKGKYEKLSSKQIKVTELPIGMGVTTYKEFLESLIVGNMSVKKGDTKLTKNKKKKFELKDVINKTKDENDDICFIIEFQNESDLNDLIVSNTLEKELKLTKSFSTNNMYLFNQKLILTKYDSPVDILCEFYDIRLEYYIKRKAYITKKLKQELTILQSKSRFIKEYMDNKLDINKKSKDVINQLLEERKYPTEIEQDLKNKTFDYLLRMPIYSFTNEKIQDLDLQCSSKKKELDFIKSKSAEQLWKIDLQELIVKLKLV